MDISTCSQDAGEEPPASLAHSMSALGLGDTDATVDAAAVAADSSKREPSKEQRAGSKTPRRRNRTSKKGNSNGNHCNPHHCHSSSILSRAMTTASAKFLHVKEHYAVLGHFDVLGRTTRATQILHEIRDEYVGRYPGLAIARWYKKALAEYHERIAAEFPNEWGKDRETILIYCSAAAQELGMIRDANRFGFPEDSTARYGEIVLPRGIIAFFEQKEDAILRVEDIVVQYREEFNKLQSTIFKPPSVKMDHFESFLSFCERNLEMAKAEILAREMIESLHIVPSLEEQWETMKASTKGCPPAVVCYDMNSDLASHISSVSISQASSESFGQASVMDFQMALHEAATKGDLMRARHWLQLGADVNAPDHFGDTPLHKAIEEGHLTFVQWLINEAADLASTRYKDHCPPLHWAAWNGQTEVVKWLVEQTGVSIHETDNSGDTPLHLACGSHRQGGLEVAKYLHLQGAMVDARNAEGKTPLHLAARTGDFETVRWLVKTARADVHLCDSNGSTCLHWATKGGRHKMVRWLSQKGANLHAPNNMGDTPLHFASGEGHTNVVRWLIFEGAHWDVRNNEGSTALHVACRNGHVEIVQWLVEIWFSVDAPDVYGDTPLQRAILGGHLAVVQCLTYRGADLQTKNKQGNTPLHTAAEHGLLDIAEWLVEKDASVVHMQNRRGETPAECARKCGHEQMCLFLESQETCAMHVSA